MTTINNSCYAPGYKSRVSEAFRQPSLYVILLSRSAQVFWSKQARNRPRELGISFRRVRLDQRCSATSNRIVGGAASARTSRIGKVERRTPHGYSDPADRLGRH